MRPIHEEPLRLDRDAVQRVRDALQSAGYTSAALEQVLGISGAEFIKVEQRKWPALTRRAAGIAPVAVLARTFMLGAILDVDTFQSAVAPTTLKNWIDLGLMAADGDFVRARWRIVPVDSHFYVLDAPWIVHKDSRNLMMAPSPSSERL